MHTGKILIAVGVIAIMAVLAVVFVPRLLNPQPEPSQVSWPTQGWPTITPEESGLDSAKIAEGLQAIQKQNTKIDSLLVIRNGAVLLDASFAPYNSAYLHDLASVTKSFMTTLIGIAIDQGKLKLDDPVLSFFPERTIANRDERKERMTVRDLVSMRNGFASGCQAGDGRTISAMMDNPDWVQGALDRNMAAEPGSKNCYDSPGMHLLSAILQKATGMTALEFARQNLFAPLGIQEAFWESDPQGITRGWGDLHLKPADAAKLGYLWLNNGAWDGKQFVSAEWVKDSVKYHSDLGGGDGYGYGWWLWDGGYGASGRGGQSVKVEPALNVVVVTTGAGFDYDTEIDRHLIGAVVDLEKPLAANPAGVAALAETLKTLAQPDSPQPVGPLPDTAKAISGRTYRFEPNVTNIETMRAEFNDSAEAILHLKYYGSEVMSTPVGLDGIYRPTAKGELMRGYWADPQTFILEIHDTGEQRIQIQFVDDRVTLESPGQGIHVEGQAE
ncbi:MAG: 6-aminohexanoate-dimer hydrolase [Chloroflexi bacterium]|nr:6-aminohexanoate-dimer hydrolase [Chloroflexota bacterium]